MRINADQERMEALVGTVVELMTRMTRPLKLDADVCGEVLHAGSAIATDAAIDLCVSFRFIRPETKADEWCGEWEQQK
jgi:hypothetical protein